MPKVSKFPAVSTLDGDEIVPLVQGGVTKRVPLDRISPTVNVKWYGAKGDGTTDDLSAIQSFIAAEGGKVPDGTYLAVVPSATSITPPEGTHLRGDDLDSKLKWERSGATGTAVLFAVNNDRFTIEYLSVEVDLPSQLNGDIFVNWVGDKTSLRHVAIDGGTTESGGARSHQFTLVTVPNSGSNEGLTYADVELGNASYAFLKSNTSESTHKRIKVVLGYYYNAYAALFAFNAPDPSGAIDDILVLGATFEDHQGETVSGFEHWVTAAGNVANFRIIGNHHGGSGDQLMRAEENAKGGVILGNTTETTGDGAVQITHNDVGGSDATPEQFSIAANVFRKSNAASGSETGIEVVFSTSDLPSLVDSAIVGNVTSGWARGYRTGESSRRLILANNVAVDCTRGLQVSQPSMLHHHNLIVDATIGIFAERGGLMGLTAFVDTASEKTAIDTPMQSNAGIGGVTGWVWETDRFDLADGSTTIDILPIGVGAWGYITYALHIGDTEYRFGISELDWDGSSLTVTAKQAIGQGTVAFTSITNNSGNLAITFNNTSGSTKSSVRLQIGFQGMYLWA